MTTNDPQKQQNQQNQQPGQSGSQQKDTGQGAMQRSENLLPPAGTDDGRYDVAEEVNLDQQSDASRRVGKAPAGATSEAMGEALRGDGAKPSRPS